MLRPLVVAPLLSLVGLGCGVVAPAVLSPAPSAEELAGEATLPTEPAMDADEVEGLRGRYLRAVEDAGGDPTAAAPRAFVEEHADRLAQAYVADPTSAHARSIIELLSEMRTPRAWPALAVALDWHPESTEECAFAAAGALADGDFSTIDAATRATALARALARVEGARDRDNRLRVELMRALRRLDHPISTDALQRVMEREDPAQTFLINRLAGQLLGERADPRSIPSLVCALFRFPPNGPQHRMNDIAAAALASIGRPALAPALALLRGENAEALAIARRYVEAVRVIDPAVAAQLSPESIVRVEAAYLIGQLGFPEGLEPLLVETRASDDERRVNGAVALVSLAGLGSADVARVREALQRVYRQSRDDARQLQLLVAIQHTYDAAHLPFLMRIAQRPDPDRRIVAYRAAAMLAGHDDAVALTRIGAHATEEYRPHFAELAPALAAAERCDEDSACWRALLTDDEPLLVGKAATMLARSSAPPEEVVPALLEQLDHQNIQVRGDVLYALDRVCTAGCEEVAPAIDALRAREAGRSAWHQIEGLALAIHGRQRARLAAAISPR